MARVLVLVCVLVMWAAPTVAELEVGQGPGMNALPRETFCTGETITDLTHPTNDFAIASTFCLETVSRVEISERFVGDGLALTGVGFWFVYTDGVPAAPAFVVSIYATGGNGCPVGAALFNHACSVVSIGPGSGSDFANPIEYFIDFAANGAPSFPKEAGVEYSLTIMNDNCPGEGDYAYWAQAAGDSVFGCVDAPDFGFSWTPFEEAGWDSDLAFYLCNEEAAPVEATTWGKVKVLYR